MNQIEKTLRKWLEEGLSDGQIKIVSYKNLVSLAKLKGKTLQLANRFVQPNHHIFLHVYHGELRLTANGDRIGFESPTYVDFIPSIQWEKLTLTNGFEACFTLINQDFFLESSLNMRSQILDGMIHFAQSPFIILDPVTSRHLCLLEYLYYNTIAEKPTSFQREILQNLTCIWQYKIWDAFFLYNKSKRLQGKTYWHDISSHFFYLAHTHCREQHKVEWYAKQIGIAPDTLSTALKRTHGHTASSILMNMLAKEAKVYLNNASFSIQQIAEILGFADQSAFGKFFKRIYGISPNAYRKQRKS